MSQADQLRVIDRRAFLQAATGLGGAALAAACGVPSRASVVQSAASATADWRDRIGLQLYTVRDQFPRDYPGTLQKVARIGYKEVQTTLTYGGHTPEQIRGYLDAAGLRAPTTHVSPRVGPDFERTLEGYQLIGHRYTTVAVGPAPTRPATAPPASGAAGAPAAGAVSSATAMANLPASMTQPQTLDSVKRTAEQLNQAGQITRRYGIKVIVHNHTNEFRRLTDSERTEYDVLVAETDPDLVAMELDIGWATAAGQNVLEMFRRNPGRYEVWHVKDLADLAALHRLPDQIDRMRAAKIVPLGEGEIDYRPFFAQASLAGMKHFYVEQDTAPESGDSIAAAAKSYQALMRILS
jgi:sugar phosphate isomerase/epimerase